MIPFVTADVLAAVLRISSAPIFSPLLAAASSSGAVLRPSVLGAAYARPGIAAPDTVWAARRV
ncbi:hypothetical protein WKR88_15015 [Trinickia caryophylli]|nr:hypothetical protein [Trinickia caryophylli]TRX15060.1 hypothetical protein FNF07_28085 [Trinickia caryophylli]WQE14919.1 hypothetical protein U0034_20410 [Trinickia caryophylli]